jgi:hypothetical protein
MPAVPVVTVSAPSAPVFFLPALNIWLEKLTSRKFLLTMAAIAIMVWQLTSNLITNQEFSDYLWKVVGLYCVGEGLADMSGLIWKRTQPQPVAPVVVAE